MKHIKLFEQFINEKAIDDAQINQTIQEFHKLQMRIVELESELKQKKAQFKEFDDQIQPILEGMKETGDKLAVTETHVVKISRFGYERATASYKDAFDLALTKVNSSTKKILEEALAASIKVSKISASYSIDTKITEANILQRFIASIKKAASDFVNIFRKESKNIDSANNELKELEKMKPIKESEFINESSNVSDKILKDWIYGEEGIENLSTKIIDACAEMAYKATIKLGDKTYWDDSMIQKHKGKIDHVATMNDFLVGCDEDELKLIYNEAKKLK